MNNQAIFKAAGDRTGLTQKERAELLRIDQTYLSKIENAKKPCSIELVAFMAETYGDYELVADYCSHCCPIGQRFHVRPCKKGMSSTVISLDVALDKAYRLMPRLREIIEDGKVDENELADFEDITLTITIVGKAAKQFHRNAANIIDLREIIDKVNLGQKEKTSSYATARG